MRERTNNVYRNLILLRIRRIYNIEDEVDKERDQVIDKGIMKGERKNTESKMTKVNPLKRTSLPYRVIFTQENS